MLTMRDVFASGPGDRRPTYRNIYMSVPKVGEITRYVFDKGAL